MVRSGVCHSSPKANRPDLTFLLFYLFHDQLVFSRSVCFAFDRCFWLVYSCSRRVKGHHQLLWVLHPVYAVLSVGYRDPKLTKFRARSNNCPCLVRAPYAGVVVSLLVPQTWGTPANTATPKCQLVVCYFLSFRQVSMGLCEEKGGPLTTWINMAEVPGEFVSNQGQCLGVRTCGMRIIYIYYIQIYTYIYIYIYIYIYVHEDGCRLSPGQTFEWP